MDEIKLKTSLKNNLSLLYSKPVTSFFLLGVCVSGFETANAALPQLELSQAPLFLGGQVEPNVFLTMDDSTSMQWEYILERFDSLSFIEGEGGKMLRSLSLFPVPSTPYYIEPGENPWYGTVMNDYVPLQNDGLVDYFLRSVSNNAIFYDPSQIYEPWLNVNDSSYIIESFPPASPSAALYNPVLSSPSLDLLTRTEHYARWFYERVGIGNDDIYLTARYGSGTGCLGANYTMGVAYGNADNCTRQNSVFTPITYFEYVDTNPITSCTVTDANLDSETITGLPFLCPQNYKKTQIWRDDLGYHYVNGFIGQTREEVNSDPSQIIVTSVNGEERTVAETIQNFSNWFQYYRSRILAARSALGQAFVIMDDDARVGLGSINSTDIFTSADDGGSGSSILAYGTMRQGVRLFSGAEKKRFLDDLYGMRIRGGTPLRQAVDDVGQYFSETDRAWGSLDQETSAEEESQHFCRQSFQILVTDGVWNSSGVRSAARVGNWDGQSFTMTYPDGSETYSPTFPDNYSHTLADVAYYYWSRDLRDDLKNSESSTAQYSIWQRLVTFGVSFGLGGSSQVQIPEDGGEPENLTVPWLDPLTHESAKIDDLWHAAINTGGKFIRANNTQEIIDGLNDIFASIVSLSSASGAGVATTGGSTGGSQQLYQTKFDSRDWSGQIIAYSFDEDGMLNQDNPDWVVGYRDERSGQNPVPLKTGADRAAITWNSKSRQGVDFQWNALSAKQKRELLGLSKRQRINHSNGNALVDALLGTLSTDRNSTLGDVVHASPVYVKESPFLYPSQWTDRIYPSSTLSENAGSSHPDFRFQSLSRLGTLYVGSNDGMLHGFYSEPNYSSLTARNGEETLAYFPSETFPKLKALTERVYLHQYFVDATPTMGDVFYDNAWHTVLVGGLGRGGQGIYALDITDAPANDTAEKRRKRVLWEFTDQDDGDLGYTMSRPNIVRLHHGKWVALFGNGYNSGEGYEARNGENCENLSDSCDGFPTLFMVDVETGELVRKLKPVNSDDDDTGYDDRHANRPNGLSSVLPVDVDGDWIVDFAYAGDLHGNLWRYDLTSQSPSQWQGQIIFRSVDDQGQPQPITTRPIAITHPLGLRYDAQNPNATDGGVLVMWSTGKLLEPLDKQQKIPTSDNPLNTVYGLWDQLKVDPPTLTKDDLLQQRIFYEDEFEFNIGEGQTESYEVRAVTQNTMQWRSSNTGYMGWYLDLMLNEREGEKVIADMVYQKDRLVFNTYIPAANACEFGGESWLMELDVNHGGRLSSSPLDFNHDGIFNEGDLIDLSSANLSDEDSGEPNRQAVGGYKKPVTVGSPRILSQTGVKNGNVILDNGADGELVYSLHENPGFRFRGRQTWRDIKK